MLLVRLTFVAMFVGLVGCGGEDAPPAAPTGLTAEALSGGAHLMWDDNADNETEYMVMRRLDTETALDHVATLDADSTEYHDAPLASGATYVYVVSAMNDAGAGDSDELTFSAP